MSFQDGLAEFVHAWVADGQARRRQENRRRQLLAEIAWTEREIRRVEDEAVRRPSKLRHVAELRHQLRHREIEFAFNEAGLKIDA